MVNAAVDNVGPIYNAQEALRYLLAVCPTFREWTSTESRAAALARVHHFHLPWPSDGDSYTRVELQALRPYAMVWTPPGGFRMEKEDVSSFVDSGTLALRLVQTAPDNDENEPDDETNLTFLKTVGKIMREMCERQGTEDAEAFTDEQPQTHIAFTAIELKGGPCWPEEIDETTEGPWVCFDIEIEWCG